MTLTDDDLELSHVLKGHIAAGTFADPAVKSLAELAANSGYSSLTDEQRQHFEQAIGPILAEPVADETDQSGSSGSTS